MENAAAGIGGLLMLVIGLVSLVILIFWTIFPIMVYVKLSNSEKLLKSIQQDLAVIAWEARKRGRQDVTETLPQ